MNNLNPKIKILHIDDEKENLDLTNTFLNKLNPGCYQIEGITDVYKGITRILSNKYDIIISDLNLNSELNGVELFVFINSSKKWRKVPYIIFSSSIFENIDEKLKSIGIKYYLPKQGDPIQIYENLNRTIIKSHFGEKNGYLNGQNGNLINNGVH